MTEAEIRDFLTTILIPGTNQPLSNFLQAIQQQDKTVLIFESPSSLTEAIDESRRKIEKTLNVRTLLTTQRPTSSPSSAKSSPAISLSQVKHIIAVASGKGGVGKSTTAVNLAIALHHKGLKVGLLDADVYGPSLPRMFAIQEKPDVSPDKCIIPFSKFGIHVMSIGFMVAEEAPMIWRGPMVQGALIQLLRDVAWPPLDILMIDMPPGTGDAQLTLAQQARMSGAIIVSTPQDIALIDARKGLNMFHKVHVPVLGIIENMSQFTCPQCQHVSHIFSHGGAQAEALKLNIPFLGELPLLLDIRQGADTGIPIVTQDPNLAHLYGEIAEKVWAQLSKEQKNFPAIEVE